MPASTYQALRYQVVAKILVSCNAKRHAMKSYEVIVHTVCTLTLLAEKTERPYASRMQVLHLARMNRLSRAQTCSIDEVWHRTNNSIVWFAIPYRNINRDRRDLMHGV